ncbi:hypothetical protein [Sphingomonas sp. MMS24-J13]|uniref:hypothetical protein n=1 Tax=Sphingomonas sp. MMS24-J13 TaxID=3238686 RepID=UPI00384E3459
MDTSLVGGVAALAGAAIGGLASFFSSWMTQTVQLRDSNLQRERSRREALFAEFIQEASRLYADALSHEKDDVCDLVQLYALVGRIRLASSAPVVRAAEETMNTIIETYLQPNRTLHQLRESLREGSMNFLLGFGEACRMELAGFSRS